MITADPNVLRYGANRFAAAAQEMKRQAIQLEQTTSNVRHAEDGWSGEGAQAFLLRGEQLINDANKASLAFESVANILSRFAMRMEHVLELRRRADRLDQQAFEYGDESLDSIHTRQHLRHQAAQLRYQADSEASIADSQASKEFQIIAQMVPSTLVPGADASANQLEGLPKHWQEYYRRHPELLEEENIAQKTTIGSNKRLDEAGVDRYLSEQLNDDEPMMDKLSGLIKGGVDGEKEMLFGLLSAVAHPVDTVQSIAYAVVHPELVIQKLIEKKDEFLADWQSENTYGWSKTLHGFVWSVMGLKGIGSFEEGTAITSRVAKSNLELFGNIINPSYKVILSDGTVIRVSERVAKSNEELLSYFQKTNDTNNQLPTTSALPEKVVNDLSTFEGKRMSFGHVTILLDKSGMKHILQRHHSDYWDGSIKSKQSFLDKKISIEEVSETIQNILSQNRDFVMENGVNGSYQVTGIVNGVEYVVGLNRGRVGQFYPIEK